MDSRIPADAIGPATEAGFEHFADRRSRLLERIGAGVVVVPAAAELLKSRDTEVPYRQSSDLYYLTGVFEPESVAVLTPYDDAHRFTLFVRPRDPEREAWAGSRLGVERAGEVYGADAVYPLEELTARLPELLRPAERIHYPIDANPRVDTLVTEALLRARRLRQRSGSGPTGITDLEDSTGELRLIKDPIELERIRVAARIAAAGHVAAMRRARAGAGEWEIQAALEATFRSLGGAAPAFQSIVGAGANATVLHYVTNQSRVREGDLVLVDAGAEWGMYCSDITRTFPASGRFTSAQRDLYEVVLAAEEAAIASATPASTTGDVHHSAVRVLVRGMLDLGVLSGSSIDEVIESGSYKRFYLHQTSHWLGLDVHDVGPYQRAGEPLSLEPGMVLTVEPGIYIPAAAEDVPEHFRGLGIRIEDDVVVTAEANEVITRGVPVAVEEIEALVGGG